MRYRDTASFGKRHEYIAIAELLKRGFDVYMTLVDDQGIDCILRLDENKYVDVQIKARSKKAEQWNFFAAMFFKPRKNFYFIFYTEKNGYFWVMPSEDVAELAHRNKSGSNKGGYSLYLPKNENGRNWSIFSKYKGDKGFDLLEKYK
ncbi:MAG: hypothetical protein ACREOW_14920 [Thermodesulfobacteriota bacterium]